MLKQKEAKKGVYILGISCYIHTSSAALIKDGKLLAAVEEERFTRKKFDRRFPINGIKFCLDKANISIDDIDFVGFYWNPWLTLRRRFLGFIRYFPASINFSYNPKNKRAGVATGLAMLRVKNEIKRYFPETKVKFRLVHLNHHLTHAASSFLVSPFEEAAIMTIDGTGEYATTLLARGEGERISVLKEIPFPHSLGAFYGAITQYLGFEVDSDEWKVMGLAPYGRPAYYKDLRKIVRLIPEGEFRLDCRYFNFHLPSKKTWYSAKFCKKFGPPRREDEDILQHHMDMAASAQKIVETTVLHIADYLYKLTQTPRLCIAGGVGLNCVMNGKLIRQSPFKQIFVQPASGDDGCSIGSSFYIYNTILKYPRNYVMEHAYLGPEFADSQIERALSDAGLTFRKQSDIAKIAARYLAEGKVIGWFQKRMEVGPRALGNRSILADPRRADMKNLINKKVKFREGFRPFAPSVLEEDCAEYFDTNGSFPFMLFVHPVLPQARELIPAVTHIDKTARIQTVSQSTNPLYWRLVREFKQLTGIPVLLNTSFNVKGEPIVCSPQDAIRTFKNSGIDVLAMGNYVAEK